MRAIRSKSDELPAFKEMQRLEFIADVALAQAGLADMLDELLDRLLTTLEVDTVAVLLLAEDGRELVARAAKGIEEEAEQSVRVPVGRGFAGRVAAEVRPIAIPDVADCDVLNPLLRERGIKSLLGVPLVFQSRVIGVLHVGSLTPRGFDREEERLLEMAGTRIAPAIEHARLLEAEREARKEADVARRELRSVQKISDVALGAAGLERLLDGLLEAVREVLAADTAAILLLDVESDELVARAARGIEGQVERGTRVPVGKGFAGRIAAERVTVAIDDVETADIFNPLLRERGIKSLVGAPLLAGGTVLGVVHVGTLTKRVFDEADIRVLQLAASRVALALDRDRLVREHVIALTMQQSLLPERLPELPGVTVAARYRPSPTAAVGGDWYDAFALADGRIGLVVGDAVSRGVRAANVMSQVRSALRTYVLDGQGPAAVLERLGRLVRNLDRREMVTLVYGVLDPDAHEFTLASAGHPPPLLASHGETAFIESARGAPLGALANPRYEERTIKLEPDSVVVMYTDGLVERRNRRLDDGLAALADVVRRAPFEPDELCEVVVAELVAPDAVDDVALLVLRTIELEPTRLELRLPAIGTSLTAMRRAMRQWLEKNGANEEEVIDILVAAGEAAGNAVEHAYGPSDARYEVEATIAGEVVTIQVRDFGRWRPPRGENRGRGTLLMQQVMDHFEVHTSDDGTVVRMQRRLAMSEDGSDE